MLEGWEPKTEEELLLAARQGLLNEGHPGLEFKQQLGEGARFNSEFAADMASFATNGGAIIIGVVDPRNRKSSEPKAALLPQDLRGMAERVEQIAMMRCQPALFVHPYSISSAQDEHLGYLVIKIPQSPHLIHMVEGAYIGRGDTTKRRLSDSEVAEFMLRRQPLAQRVEEELQNQIDRDPWELARKGSQLAHLYLVAIPHPGRPKMLLEHLTNYDSPAPWFLNLIQKRRDENPRFQGQFAPDFDLVDRFATRADGWAVTTFALGPGRQVPPDAREERLIEVELTEDGIIKLFSGRASEWREDRSYQIVFEVLIAGLTRRLIRLTGDIAKECGYTGCWAFGIAIQDLLGTVSWERADRYMGVADSYPESRYSETTTASLEEISSKPGQVTSRLVSRLLRTLGSADQPRIQEHLKDTESA